MNLKNLSKTQLKYLANLHNTLSNQSYVEYASDMFKNFNDYNEYMNFMLNEVKTKGIALQYNYIADHEYYIPFNTSEFQIKSFVEFMLRFSLNAKHNTVGSLTKHYYNTTTDDFCAFSYSYMQYNRVSMSTKVSLRERGILLFLPIAFVYSYIGTYTGIHYYNIPIIHPKAVEFLQLDTVGEFFTNNSDINSTLGTQLLKSINALNDFDVDDLSEDDIINSIITSDVYKPYIDRTYEVLIFTICKYWYVLPILKYVNLYEFVTKIYNKPYEEFLEDVFRNTPDRKISVFEQTKLLLEHEQLRHDNFDEYRDVITKKLYKCLNHY